MLVLNWGLTPYQHAWQFQESYTKARRQGKADEDVLVLLEHPPVITVGRSGVDGHILVDSLTLKEKQCEVYHVDRGGDVTYHGPGQLVGYPLLDLKRYGKDVHAYVHNLEEVIIRTLADFGIIAGRDEKYTGVWVGEDKICAIGIGARNWLSFHGFALNIDADLSYFSFITPCGIQGRGVTSMEKLLGTAPAMQEVRSRLIAHFQAVFQIAAVTETDGRWLGDTRPPSWLKGRVASNQNASEVHGMLDELSLNTVCSGAHCPNMGECYASRTATFMILGSQCTRQCRFCAVQKGPVQPVDAGEPERVAHMVKRLGLQYTVITSVTRDDLPDGGAGHFARTIEAIRRIAPGTLIEVLIPDLQGNEASLDTVIAARPEVINHNVETVPALYSEVRPQANYQRSLAVLDYVKRQAPHIKTKSGIMVGLGETPAQVAAVLADLRSIGCDFLTVGQYLAPSAQHIAIKEYVAPEQFVHYRELAESFGFLHAASGPLVRSSYRAADGFFQKERLSS
ncbi:lipoyl synthase [Propionispora vibrioides]|uniref:Multifunctional fusion protein n=1 Tax=Propionispora vibrioides TaxID=112903 RepID=A0A1H8R2W1_9FIRM|nr:lipoyl synthase [Propionispora vibrioides]SEO60243.1 lipoic acid synthetase [Propionispora vibrioides]